MRPIVPMSDMNRRIPEAGRIRTGIKSGRAMKALDTFRFTSSDEAAITEIAAIYGGEPGPWTNERGLPQFEVITEANEIRVILPPDPLQDTPVYELWSRGGCMRRCDGRVCVTPIEGPDGYEMGEVPCVCIASEKLDCKPTTRLNVLLPDIKFGGSWRLETHSWNAAQELPGMVDAIEEMQARGLPPALLALERRVTVSMGQTRKFVVPMLRMAVSPEQMVAGASMAQIAQPKLVELEQAAPDDEAPTGDDEVIDAEVVDDTPVLDFRKQCHRIWEDHALSYMTKIVEKASGGRTMHPYDLTTDELRQAVEWCDAVEKGWLELQLEHGKLEGKWVRADS